MLNTFINSFKVSFAENANVFIYFLKRMPLLGKKIQDNLYKQTDAKLVIGVICEILKVLIEFVKRALYLGLMVILPAYLMTKNIKRTEPIFIHIFFFLSFMLGPFITSTVFDPTNKAAFNMITLMKSDAREYYVSKIIYKNIINFTFFLIPLIIIGGIIGFSPLKAIFIVVELIALRVIGEWFHIYIYDKTDVMIVMKGLFIYPLIICGLALAYALPLLKLTINFNLILFNPFVVMILLVLGSVVFIYLWQYRGYTVIAKTILTKNNLFNGEAFKTDMTFGSVKIDEKKMKKEDLNTKKYNNKQGYEYLNSLFFLRFRRIMVKPMINRVIFIGIIFLICMGFVLFTPGKRVVIINTIKKNTSFIVFIMYMMSTGERICKAMFFNCDISLLRYGYYKEASVILSNFTSRIKRVVMLNLIPALALCVAIACITIFSGYSFELIGMIPLFLCTICLACFFSIHHLFMYYVLQPYTAELTIKSPLFRFISLVVYLVSYMCLQIKTSSYYFTVGIIITTIVYMIIALILTYRVAPKTFKLK